MSIFGIILICLIIAIIIFAIGIAIIELGEPERTGLWVFIITCVSFCVWIGLIFIGIGINTESEKIYIKEYLAQKETIEASLEIELSGLERLEIVKQVTELNAEFAYRKANFELWHFVVYDNTIYDGIELIKLN